MTDLTPKDQMILEMFKHYSNIRFLMLPVYFTTVGALFVAFWKIYGSPDSSLALWISLAGICVSLLFIIYEWRLSKAFALVSEKLPEDFQSLGKPRVVGWVTSISWVVYGLPGVFWATRFFYYLGCCTCE